MKYTQYLEKALDFLQLGKLIISWNIKCFMFLYQVIFSHICTAAFFFCLQFFLVFFFSLITKEQPDFDNGLKRVNETMIKGDCCEKFIFENIFL